MIDPKYADLPGIAYDQPDVYETDNDVEKDPVQTDINVDEDAVEKIYINAADAFCKFKDKRISSKGTDFSDKIYLRTHMGYNICGEWGFSDNKETPIQKYQRLKYEFHELLDQIYIQENAYDDSEESKTVMDIFYEIENTGKELASMSIEKILCDNMKTFSPHYQEVRLKELQSQIKILKEKNHFQSSVSIEASTLQLPQSLKCGLIYKMIYFPDKSKIQDFERLSGLEKRVRYLENVIGTSSESTVKYSQILKSQGIVKSIEKLMTNTCMLTSSQLDIFESKIASLIRKMDNISHKKTLFVENLNHEKQISELYVFIKETEFSSPILTQVIDRLLSLNNLHQKATEFVSQLNELEIVEQNMMGSLAKNKVVLAEMQKNFSSNLEIIANNIISLNERVKKC